MSSNRSTLEAALQQWSYKKEAKLTLVASETMRRQHLALLREKRLGENMTLPTLSPAERRARMAIAGAPLLYRADPPPANPNDPTPQWQAKAGSLIAKTHVGKGDVVPVKQYRIKHVIEAHGDKLQMSQRSALERFLQDASHVQRWKVVDLNSAGRVSNGDRLGGLGSVPQSVRDGHARHEWVLVHLAPELRDTASALVTRELLKQDGAPFSLEDFGAKMFPTVGDRNRRWGSAAGAIWALAGQLVHLYSKCPIRVRHIDDEERMLEAAE